MVAIQSNVGAFIKINFMFRSQQTVNTTFQKSIDTQYV